MSRFPFYLLSFSFPFSITTLDRRIEETSREIDLRGRFSLELFFFVFFSRFIHGHYLENKKNQNEAEVEGETKDVIKRSRELSGRPQEATPTQQLIISRSRDTAP